MIKKVNQSNNELAEQIVGKRWGGIPLQEPFELDYACPLCCKSITRETEIFTEKGDIKPEYDRLRFSEYNGFMWCSHCNIDIPSFLCLCANTKEAITIYTDRFLNFMQEYKERLYQDLSSEEKDLQKLRIENIDLKGEIKQIKFENALHKSCISYLNNSWIQKILLKIHTFKFHKTHKTE